MREGGSGKNHGVLPLVHISRGVLPHDYWAGVGPTYLLQCFFFNIVISKWDRHPLITMFFFFIIGLVSVPLTYYKVLLSTDVLNSYLADTPYYLYFFF